MAVVSFRTHQEEIDHYKKALDVVNLVKSIFEIPNLEQRTKEVAGHLAKAQELSEAKKKELSDANEIITQSHEFIKEFEAEKITHLGELELKNKDIEINRVKLQAEIQSFAIDRQSILDFAKKSKTEHENKLAEAQKILDTAHIRNVKAEQTEKLASDKIKKHEEDVAQFTDAQKAVQLALEIQRSTHENNVKKLAEDKAVLLAKRKKFEDALKD